MRRLAVVIAIAAGCVSAPDVAAPAPPAATSPEPTGPELVSFPSRDADLTGGEPTTITGVLLHPSARGRRPAMILLHGCAGLYKRSGGLTARHRDWAERLAAMGFVVLLPDSFGPRGVVEICSGREPRKVRSGYERARDGWGAATYLAARPDVDPVRIGVLGWSNGAMTLLAMISAHSRARPAELAPRLALAIAFYPGCKETLARDDWMPPIAPLHLLIGASDDWTPAEPCRELIDRTRAAGGAADIVVYPESFHDFDDPSLPLQTKRDVATTESHTATIGTNPAARADAITRVTKLLTDALAP